MSVITQNFPPLEQITRPTIPTDQAAYYLNRRPQTLRIWAMRQDGLLQALRVNGRLAWPVKEIKKILGVEV
ncbi:MAG: DNA-binding protein [Nitrosomonas ureae]